MAQLATTPPQAVTTLAIIKVNWDQRQDYIANFLPLVAHCLQECHEEAVSLPELQKSLWECFGIRIPGGALKTLLSRASREDLVQREDGTYKPNQTRLADYDLGPSRQKALREHANLVGRLVSFASSEFNRTWSEEQAEEALLSYVEAMAAPILKSAAGQEHDLMQLPQVKAQGSVVVSKFVVDLQKREPEGFQYLETIVKGSMLANVLYWPETLSGGKPRLKGLDLYIDTPLLLIILGFAAEEMRCFGTELVEILSHQGARLRVFAHTLVELEGVLAAAAQVYRHGGKAAFPGDVLHFFVENDLSQSDVELLIARKGEKLRDLGIEVVDAPLHTEKLNLDEDELERCLQEGVGYTRREALLRDLDSLTAIHRLRQGVPCDRVDACPAILATTNPRLVQTAADYFEHVYESRSAPICVLDSTFTALVWLMDPIETASLPRKQMIATSYAALSPPEPVWRCYLEEIARLEAKGELSEEDVALAKFTSAARGELMRLTLGDASAYVEGTVQQVLARARREARADAEMKLQGREQEIAEVSVERDEVLAERKGEQEALIAAKAEAQRTEERHEQQRMTLAKRLSRCVGLVCLFAMSAAFLGGTALAASGLLPESWSGVPVFALPVVFYLALLQVLNSIWGLSLKSISARFEVFITPRVYEMITAALTPRSDHSETNS